ncbi:hypothetical protein SAMN04489740_0860 [Arthrobacter alpinus]|uniref:Uncharacterized protein n=1 Tax=Arthrobacter alpinus TaxID=656366 RepID=A0A1H5GVI4_9MICC|nr:hypothetical protein [Arthrobacter alpinus]SEE19707.1 hypothetical protein SAMN04489740_0860 [Arthrobacter alpinus]
MATLKHKSGHTVTTSYAPEIVSLRSQGYQEIPDAAVAATETEVPAVDAKPAKTAPKAN